MEFGNIKPIDKYQDLTITKDVTKAALDNGLNLSEYLERVDPSERYVGKAEEGTTAFERQLLKCGLAVNSDPLKGIQPSKLHYFLQDEQHRILFKEYLNREAYFTAIDSRYDVELLLALTRRINGETYQGVQMDTTAIDANPYFSIAKGGEIPTIALDWSDTNATIYKRGVALKWTYEFARRATVDMVGKVVQRLAISDRRASFYHGVSSLYTGATSVLASTYDSSVNGAGVITYKAWLKWLDDFAPYTPSAVVCNIDTAVLIINMTRPNFTKEDALAIMSNNTLSKGGIILNPGNIAATPPILIVPSTIMADNYAMVFDKAFALERLIEVGSDISETQKFITNQTEVATFTLTEGYALFDSSARHVIKFSNS